MKAKRLVKGIAGVMGITVMLSGCGSVFFADSDTKSGKDTMIQEPYVLPTTKDCLEAKEMEGIAIHYERKNPTEDIICNKKGYAEQYREFRSLIDSSITDMEHTEETFSLVGEKEYYISQIPIRYWDALNNEINLTTETVLLFSKNLEKIGQFDFTYENEKVAGSGIRSADALFVKGLQENKELSYIPVFNGNKQYLLGEDNELTGGAGRKVKVNGDYFGVFDAEKIAVSWEQLTDKQNMELVTVNDWKQDVEYRE